MVTRVTGHYGPRASQRVSKKFGDPDGVAEQSPGLAAFFAANPGLPECRLLNPERVEYQAPYATLSGLRVCEPRSQGLPQKNAANPGLCSTTPSALKYRKADGYTDFFDTLWEARDLKRPVTIW
jgi:hypothetical protein